MKDETFEKIINKIDRAYLYAQVIFSCLIILFGVSYALRCIIERSGDIYVFCFAAMAYVGYKFMLRASLEELREARKQDKNERGTEADV